MDFTKQNSFSRSMANDAKMGAYYTDEEHCKWISKFLKFPEEEVCALEPSIGDGKAIKAVVNKEVNMNVKLFGVELNKQTVQLFNDDPHVEKILQADFLNGVKISHSVFTFCFSNPPYGVDEQMGKGERLERSFLEKLTNYMKNGGVLVYVIPYSVFSDESFLKIWCARYETKHVYRFHEKEYQKYKQIVAIGIKRHGMGYLRSEYDRLLLSLQNVDDVPLLPTDYDGEKILVKPSSTDSIEYFSSKDFNIEDAKRYLSKSALYNLTGEKLSQDEFSSCSLTSPPIKLKKDLMYLLAVSGGGQGLAGSVLAGDLHLQRGTVKVVQSSQIESKGEESNKFQERVRTSSSITMTIIENDGKITRFE